MKCFASGRASAITLAREIFTPLQKRLWIDTAEISRGESSKCVNFLESGNTPRMQSPALPLINRFRSSKRTPVVFWHGFSICANQSIPAWASENCGNMQRVSSQNPTPRLSTPHFSILARLFAHPGSRDATVCPVKTFCRAKNPAALPIQEIET